MTSRRPTGHGRLVEGGGAPGPIKCGVQDGSLLSCREAADQLAERVRAEVVQVIGHRFSLYRASSRKDIEHIKLD